MNILVFLIILSVIITVFLMIYTIVNHQAEKSFYLIFLTIANLLYTFGNLLEITAPTLELGFYGVRVQYMGGPFIMPLTYLFYRDFYGKKRWSGKKIALFFVIPVISILALQAFPSVRTHYSEIWFHTNKYVADVQHSSGFTYYINTIYNYGCVVLSLRLILSQIRHGGAIQKRQSLVLLVGWLLPLGSSLRYILSSNEYYFDSTPITYVALLLVLLYAVLMHNILNVLPMARAQMIDELEDAFIVCDSDFRFLDANQSARRLFPKLEMLATGELMDFVDNFKSEGEVCIIENGEPHYYKAIATSIRHGAKGSICVVFRDVTEENRLLKSLNYQATVDSLTGLFNRGTFFSLAEEKLREGKDGLHSYGLLMIDVDHFKYINDTFGHPCGDAVLKSVADIIKGSFCGGDIVGRYGGEEITVLMEDITEVGLMSAAENLRNEIVEASLNCHDQSIALTVSIGAAYCSTEENRTLEYLLSQADKALYHSKDNGRNRTSVYHDGNL